MSQKTRKGELPEIVEWEVAGNRVKNNIEKLPMSQKLKPIIIF